MVLTSIFMNVKPASAIIFHAEDVHLWQEYSPTLSLCVQCRTELSSIYNFKNFGRLEPGSSPPNL